jgi:hypothetical protein
MQFEMQDAVPWTFIYGAQNERHRKEVQKLTNKCKTMRSLLIRQLLSSQNLAFDMSEPDTWIIWQMIKVDLTVDEIESSHKA